MFFLASISVILIDRWWVFMAGFRSMRHNFRTNYRILGLYYTFRLFNLLSPQMTSMVLIWWFDWQAFQCLFFYFFVQVFSFIYVSYFIQKSNIFFPFPTFKTNSAFVFPFLCYIEIATLGDQDSRVNSMDLVFVFPNGMICTQHWSYTLNTSLAHCKPFPRELTEFFILFLLKAYVLHFFYCKICFSLSQM